MGVWAKLIKLEVNDKCHDCPYFEASADRVYAEEEMVVTIITCKHGVMCDYLEEYLKKNKDIKTSITIDGKEVAKTAVKYSTVDKRGRLKERETALDEATLFNSFEKDLKVEFPNCYIDCNINKNALGMNQVSLSIKGYKNNKPVEIHRIGIVGDFDILNDVILELKEEWGKY